MYSSRDARLLLAVAIRLRNCFKTLLEDARLFLKRTIVIVHVKGTISAVPRDAARIIAAPAAIPSLYLVAFSQPAAPTAPRARASAAATAAVERADEALLDARLGLAVVVGDVKPKN